MRDIFYFLTEHDILEPTDLCRPLNRSSRWITRKNDFEWTLVSDSLSYWVDKTLMDLHLLKYRDYPDTMYIADFEVIRKLYG